MLITAYFLIFTPVHVASYKKAVQYPITLTNATVPNEITQHEKRTYINCYGMIYKEHKTMHLVVGLHFYIDWWIWVIIILIPNVSSVGSVIWRKINWNITVFPASKPLFPPTSPISPVLTVKPWMAILLLWILQMMI